MSHSRAGVGRAQAPGPPDGGASDSLAAGRASPLHHGPSLSLPAVRLHHASHHALCHALHAPFITPSATPLHHAPSTRPFGTLPHHAPSPRPPPRPSITPSPERSSKRAHRLRSPRRPSALCDTLQGGRTPIPTRTDSDRLGPTRTAGLRVDPGPPRRTARPTCASGAPLRRGRDGGARWRAW